MHRGLTRFEFFKILALQQITYFHTKSEKNGISLKLAQRDTGGEKATTQGSI